MGPGELAIAVGAAAVSGIGGVWQAAQIFAAGAADLCASLPPGGCVPCVCNCSWPEPVKDGGRLAGCGGFPAGAVGALLGGVLVAAATQWRARPPPPPPPLPLPAPYGWLPPPPQRRGRVEEESEEESEAPRRRRKRLGALASQAVDARDL